MLVEVDRKCASCGYEFAALKPPCPACWKGYGLAGGVDPRLLDALKSCKGVDGVTDWVGAEVYKSLAYVEHRAGGRQTVFELFWLLRKCWVEPFPGDQVPFPWFEFSATGLLEMDPEGVRTCAECWRENSEPIRVWSGSTRHAVNAKRDTLSRATGEEDGR